MFPDGQTDKGTSKQTREPVDQKSCLCKLKLFIVMLFLCKVHVHLISIQDSFSEIGRLVLDWSTCSRFPKYANAKLNAVMHYMLFMMFLLSI